MLDSGVQQAMQNFTLDGLHAAIHNYMVSPTSQDCKTRYEDLMFLIEFLLQDEKDLLASIDTTKLEGISKN